MLLFVLAAGCNTTPTHSSRQEPQAAQPAKQKAAAAPVAKDEKPIVTAPALGLDAKALPEWQDLALGKVPLAAGPLSLTPQLAASCQHPVADRASHMGWSQEGESFGYCPRDDDSPHCERSNPGQAIERIPRGQYIQTLRAAAPDSNAWRFGQTIHFEGEKIKTEPSVFVLRARISGEPDAFVIERIPAPYKAEEECMMHLDGFEASADGSVIGAVVHANRGEFSDRYILRTWRAEELAGRVLNGAGLEHHRSGRFERAAQLFYQAAQIDPQSKLAPYNLACALARREDPRAQVALTLAIRLGGPSVQSKVAKDPDFASFAQTPWFQKMTH